MIVQGTPQYDLHEAIKRLLDACLQESPQHAKELVIDAWLLCARHGVDISNVAKPYGKTKTRVAITIIMDAIDWSEQEKPSMASGEDKRKLLAVALNILEDAALRNTPGDPWAWVEYAEIICGVLGVDIGTTLGDGLWPEMSSTRDVINRAINNLPQKGA